MKKIRDEKTQYHINKESKIDKYEYHTSKKINFLVQVK